MTTMSIRALSLACGLTIAAAAQAGDGPGRPTSRPASRPTSRPARPNKTKKTAKRLEAYGIRWRSDLALASKDAGRGQGKPIAHWRVLGDITGFM